MAVYLINWMLTYQCFSNSRHTRNYLKLPQTMKSLRFLVACASPGLDPTTAINSTTAPPNASSMDTQLLKVLISASIDLQGEYSRQDISNFLKLVSLLRLQSHIRLRQITPAMINLGHQLLLKFRFRLRCLRRNGTRARSFTNHQRKSLRLRQRTLKYVLQLFQLHLFHSTLSLRPSTIMG